MGLFALIIAANSAPMLYTESDLKRFFPTSYLARGRHYQRQGRVLDLSVHQQGKLITGQVVGSEAQPYEVEIHLGCRGKRLQELDSHCSCPVGYNCKHGVAVLLEALQLPSMSHRLPDPVAPAAPAPDDGLSSEARHWLQRLKEATHTTSEYSPTVRDRLLYILKPPKNSRGAVAISILKARLLKNGDYGHTSDYGLFSALFGHRAQFVTHTDVALIQDLQRIDASGEHLRGSEGARLLPRLLATGRCHWESPANPALREGEARQARLEWQMTPQGLCQLGLITTPAARVVALHPPWYLDVEQQLCGPALCQLPSSLAAELVGAPALKPDELTAVQAWLGEHLDAASLPPVPEFTVEELRDIHPTPSLYLYTRQWGAGSSDSEAVDGARLSFDYQGRSISPNESRSHFDRYQDGILYRVHRNTSQEIAYIRQLIGLGMDSLAVFLPDYHLQPDMVDDLGFEDTEAWIDFILDQVPQLRQQGWQVVYAPKFRFNLTSPSDWYVDLQERGMDWFNLSLGVEVDGQQLNLLPALAQYLEQRSEHGDHSWLQDLDNDSKLMLPLADGRLLALPAGRVKGILSTLVELYDTPLGDDGALTLPRIQALRLEELRRQMGDQPLRWQGGESLRELAAKIHTPPPPLEEPIPGLNAELRDYQKQGIQWLGGIAGRELGGILADDMGLGKTLQALAHIQREKHAGRMQHPCLVVAPTSLMGNWQREAERFTPEMRVLVLQGPQRRQLFEKIPEHELILTTYPLLPRDQQKLLPHEYHLVVLDEAQNIKNPRSQAGGVVRQLRTRQRLCLTGTPLENHLGELWSLFDFLLPGLLGDQDQFRRLFRRPIEQFSDLERQQHLSRRVAPFMLRRRKQDVVAELPPKTEMDRAANISGKQRDLYESIRFAMQKKVRDVIKERGMARSTLTILEALLRLRQVCCDPRLVKLDSARGVKQSAKLDLLMGLLPDMLEEGRRVLLFSQFTSMLSLIQKELDQRKLAYVKLTGQTRDRDTPVKRFQEGEVPLFLISLKAGGTGLNLTAADTVIHYDPWWNPAVEAQATDRAHRIGQDKPVFVYRLYTEGTVEAKMQELKARKQALSDGILGEGSGSLKGWDQADLDFLLAPLE